MILAIAIASSVVAVGLGAFSAALIITNDKLQKKLAGQREKASRATKAIQTYDAALSRRWAQHDRFRHALEDIVDMATPNMAHIGKRMADVAAEALDG